MESSRYINVLKKHLACIVLLTLLGGGAVYVFSRHQPRVYEATATLVINAAAPSSLIPYLSAVVGNNGAVSSVQALADSYAILLRSHSFDAEVIQKLHLAVTPDQLGSSISSGLIGDTNYWTISVAWNDPVQAAALANGIARIFIEANAAAQAAAQSSVAASDLGQALTYFQRKIKVLRRRFDAIMADPRATPAQVNTAEDQLGTLEDIYYKLLATAGTSALSTGTNTAVLGDPAVVPGTPISPRATRNVVLGLVSGLLIGLALAFLLDYLDYSLRTAEDLEQLMGQAPLGVIGTFAAGGRRQRGLFGLPFKHMAARAMSAAARPANGNGRGAGGAHLRDRSLSTLSVVNSPLVTLLKPRAPASEAFRILRTNLDFSSLDRPLKSLVVTSVAPGEGKSTVAANVAISMAQAGKKVILVDANLRRPSLGALFSLTAKAGLTTTLRERGDQARALDEALQPAMVPNLQVLISGPQPPNPAELLSSESMTRVLRELEARADLVIFDTPHMGPLTDAVVLSARASGTLLVIRAGSTRRTVITNSLYALRKVGSNVVGTVLNMADMKASTRHSYYDYQTYTSATAKAATSGGTRGT